MFSPTHRSARRPERWARLLAMLFLLVATPALAVQGAAQPVPRAAGALPAARQPVPAAQPITFADDTFHELWTRTDALVAQGSVNYSWNCGPGPVTERLREPYLQSPQGKRLVQYFDKSRMEINQPDAPRGPFYVTNGRLADELITGRRQVGDQQYDLFAPAMIAAAGDLDNPFPLYRDLRPLHGVARPNTQRADQRIIRAPDGVVETHPFPDASSDPGTVIVTRVHELGIPAVLWDFMNQSGPILENGVRTTATPLFDWRYVIGEPLTEAYWTRVKVGGVEQDVLLQAFERRILTYTPSNPTDWRVEMGNIGRHYYEWRYGRAMP